MTQPATRSANHDDITRLIEIEASIPTLHEDPKGGFITHRFSTDTWKSFISSNSCRVIENSSIVVGALAYAEPNHKGASYLASLWNQVTWNSEVYSIGAFTWLDRICVDVTAQGMGYGTLLLKDLLLQPIVRPLLTASAVEPLRNNTAERIYERVGLRRYGQFAAAEYRDLTQYRSTIWGI